jgi:hypothetical protein
MRLIGESLANLYEEATIASTLDLAPPFLVFLTTRKVTYVDMYVYITVERSKRHKLCILFVFPFFYVQVQPFTLNYYLLGQIQMKRINFLTYQNIARYCEGIYAYNVVCVCRRGELSC